MKKTNLKNSALAIVFSLWAFASVSAQQNDNLIKSQFASEREKYGLTADDISGYLITDQYTDEQTGLSYNYIQQRHHNIAVFNAISVFLIKNNSVLYFKPSMISNLKQKIKTDKPSITAEAAIGYALMNIGRNEIAPVKLINTDNNLNTLTYESPSISASPIKVQLVYRAMDEGVFLAWDVSIEMIKETHWWNVRIDALTGNYLDKNDWTVNCNFDNPNHNCVDHQYTPAMPLSPLPPPPPLGEYNVYAFPVEAPSFGGRTNLINPENLTASPFGWHDDNGITGNEYTITRGNNVHAYEDANSDNLPGYSPNSATLQFNYPVDLTQAPLSNQNASITNLFYVNNRIHDALYYAGFTAAAGNFQQNNYGNGGLGSDYVLAEAFDGGGTNNANFGTPPDGSKPRMQMYLWTAPTPDRDGSFDNGIVAHEYGHGVSNRLTGGPANSSCLGNAEQGGEGWSDWLALAMTIEPGDTVAGGMLTQARGIGTYALDQPNTGQGIRRYRYSVDMAINPQTYADLATSGTGSHNKGEIWCDAIWDMTCFLVNDLGFNSNPSVATAGNNIAMRLVLEGMKLQPCSPGYLDARDAILTADAVLYNNAHRCRIWEAFARRGMGLSALQGSSSSSTDQTAAFNLPPICFSQPPVAAFTSNVSTIPCAGTVLFTDGSTQALTSAWDFGDGGTSFLTNPFHQYNSPGTYNVKLVVTSALGSDSVVHPITVTSALSATATATPSVICAGNSVQLNVTNTATTNLQYSLTSIAYAPVAGTGTSVALTDDQLSAFLPIGFSFTYDGIAYTQFKICSNGYVTFDSLASTSSYGVPIPNTALPNNFIALIKADLNPANAGSSINYFTTGIAPNQKLVVNFVTSYYLQPTKPVSVQAIFYQTSNIIELHVDTISSGLASVQGIENLGGTNGKVILGRNGSIFSANDEGWRFAPSSFSYNWIPGNLNGAAQTVNPIASTTYTVNVSDGSGCVEAFTTPLVTVTTLTPIITGNTTICGSGSVTLSAPAAGIINPRYASTVINFSSQYTPTDWSANQILGAPDVYPSYGSIPQAWSPNGDPREFITLGFANPSPINYIDIYETYKPGAIDTVYVKNPATGLFEVVYSVSASPGNDSARILHISFPMTTFNVSEIRIAINDAAIGSWNEIDAVQIGMNDTYSHLWSTGATTQTITVNTGATFTVTVTNANGCTGSASAQVTKKAKPTVTVTPSAAVICPPDVSVSLTAGSTTSTYAWSPATGLNQTTGASVIANPAATTTYIVTATSTAGCTATKTAKVTVKPKPVNTTTINITATSATAKWDTVACAVGYKYQYRKQGVTTWTTNNINSNSPTKNLSGLLAATTYQWRVKSKYVDGTYSVNSTIASFTTLALRSGMKTIESNNELVVYPNPADDKLNLEFPFTEGEANISFVNSLGQTVLVQKVKTTDEAIELNIEGLPTGLYFITVQNGEHTFCSRFIKK